MSGRPSLLRRLTADVRALDAESLQEDVRSCEATPIGTLKRGDRATVSGRVRSVSYTPRESVPTVTAELFDGSESIRLVWLGRRRIAGMEPGRRLIVQGRVGDFDGHPAIYNPWYELRAAQ